MFEQQQPPPFLVGERAVWLGSGSGLPQGGSVRWIGKLPSMGPGWTVGLELDRELPYGGIDGSWCGRQLFQCQTKHGLLVPATVVVKEDSLLRSFGAAPVINKARAEPPPKAPKTPVAKPKRTKSGATPRRKTSTPQSPDPEEPIRPVVKPVRRNSKKAREQAAAELQSPRPPRKVSQPLLQSSDAAQDEAFKALPKSALAPPLDSLPIDDTVLKLIAARLPQLSGVSILSEPKKSPRRTSEEVRVPPVDLSGLPASAIRVPAELRELPTAPKADTPPPPPQEVQTPVVQEPEKPPSPEPEPEPPAETAEAVPEPQPEVEEAAAFVPVAPVVEEDLSEAAEEEEQSGSSPVPPPPPKTRKDAKAGYFHTAPARPRRASVKKRAPLPPIQSRAEDDAPKPDSTQNSQPPEDPNAPPRVPLRRHNSLNGPRRPLSDVAPQSSAEELIYQWFDAIGDAPSAPPRQHAPMNNKPLVPGSPSISPSVSCTSFEDAVAAADAIYSQRVDKHFANLDSGSSVGSTTSTSSTATFTSSNQDSSSAGANRKSGGGLFSFLKWLRKNDSGEDEQQVISEQPLSRASSTNSLGTVVSAASSFAFVRPFNNNDATRANLHYAPPLNDSDTYKQRLKQRERSRLLDKGLTFKRKYKLRQFACSQETVFSDTLKPARGKRKAPAPPLPTEHYSDYSLPINLEHRKHVMEVMEPVQVRLHRRTASESSKDKRAGAYCHVKGKRKAPQPPRAVLKPVNNFPSLGRNKKRPAPSPPENLSRLSPIEKQRLIDCINRAKDNSPPPHMQGPALVTSQPIILAAPEMPKTPPVAQQPLSPKPWYKRSAKFIPIKQSSKKAEEEMPEVNYARVLPPQDPSKRKSAQFQALTKLSDIDKEAAAIIQYNQQKAAELLAAKNDSYYLPSPPDSPKEEETPAPKEEEEEEEAAATALPTKGLISKFNAITSISKVTVNSSKAALVGLLINDNKHQNKRISPIAAVQEEAEEETKAEVIVEDKKKEVEKVKILEEWQRKEEKRLEEDRKKAEQRRQEEEKKRAEEQEQKKRAEELERQEKEKKLEEERQLEEKRRDEASKTGTLKVTNNLYPRLSTFEPRPETPERGETPLPLSIRGVPEGLTLNRQKKTTWTCPRCTLENESWRFTCDACNMWRPSKSQDESSSPPGTEATGVNTVEEASKSIQKLANDVTKEEESFKKPEPIGPIDWEAELKHYFPNKQKSPERKSESPPKMNARVAEAIKILEGKQSPTPGPTYVKAPEKKIEEPKAVYAVASRNGVKPPETPVQKKPEETKPAAPSAFAGPSTFIGGKTAADLKKMPPAAASTQTPPKKPVGGKVVGSKEPTSPKDVDEVRKARLAFFNKDEKVTEAKPPASPRLTRAAQPEPVTVQPPDSPKDGRTAEIATDTAELVVFSLKEKGMAVVAAANAADLEEKRRIKEKLKEMKNSLPFANESANKGAIKKAPIQDKSPVVAKPTKVSSSAQTSGVILKAPVIKEPTAKVTTASPVVAKKLISRSASFKGSGPFLLMGPKDFASIEATKSKNSLSTGEDKKLQHVYANIPSPGLVPSATPNAKNASPVPAGAKSPEPAVSVSPALPPKSPSPNIKKQRPGIQPVTVVKVEINAQTLEDDYDDDDEEFEDVPEDRSSLSGAADSGSVAGSVGDSSDVEKLAGTLTGAKGLAAFKADLASTPAKAANTLAVNRILRRLETAIGNGDHRNAAVLAKQLARMKINCKVERNKAKVKIEPEMFTVDMYVEDKVSHQGPIPLSVCAEMTVGELKAKVHQEFEIPANCQRWILGKQLASDDNKTLQQHSVASGGCIVFLYLVAPPERTDSASPASKTDSPAPVAATPPPAPVEDVNQRILPLAPENQRGPGWYYNFEEDRYSYCESSDEEDPEDEPVQVQPLPPPEPLPQPAPREKTPPLAEPEEDFDDGGQAEGAAAFEPTAPPATLTQEKKTGTLQLGWTCPLCTLVNPPTRPGCEACTTDRPASYRIPTQYAASEQEATRLKQEEENDMALHNEAEGQDATAAATNYEALLALDKMDLVPNVERFDCPVCFAQFPPGEGAMLRECLHTFCRPCLAHTVQFSEEVQVRCPFRNDQYVCDATLQEREVRALVTTEVYDKLQAKSVAQAENKIQNAFHCKTPDCNGWCIFEDNVNDFRCPVCQHHNCLTCQAIHEGINCKQYQEGVTQASETDAEARRTKEMLQEMVERGEALCCPTCKVVLMKKWGCDWLRCSMCKTEICWVTRGPRWGPAGKGDISGGCKCGINGVKCHPKCNYCH